MPRMASRTSRTGWCRRSPSTRRRQTVKGGATPSFTALFLVDPVQSDLRLLRIAQAAANRAVEVEQQARRCRIPEVLGPQHVEHLHDRLEASPLTEVERPCQPDVPREVAVVLAQRVALQDVAVRADPVRGTRRALARAQIVGAAFLGPRLRGIDDDPVVEEYPTPDMRQQPAVNAVTLVPIAPVVLGLERIRPRVAEAEGIALVVVVRFVE